MILSNQQENEGAPLPDGIDGNYTQGKITHLDFDGTKHLYFSQWLNDKIFSWPL